MIVRQFISWVRNASAGERAEATRALARAWLISDLSEDDRIAAEGALLMLLDDPIPGERRKLCVGVFDQFQRGRRRADLGDRCANGSRQVNAPRDRALRLFIAGGDDVDKIGVDQER